MHILRSSHARLPDTSNGLLKKAEHMEFSGDTLMAIERVSIAINPTKVVELCNAFSSLMGPTRAERGCLRCELYTGWTRSNTVLMEVLWRTHEDLVQHLKSDRYKSFLQLMETSAEQPLIEFFFVSHRRGLDIVEQAREKLA
jgi:quinol monooxygenase YgiN